MSNKEMKQFIGVIIAAILFLAWLATTFEGIEYIDTKLPYDEYLGCIAISVYGLGSCLAPYIAIWVVTNYNKDNETP